MRKLVAVLVSVVVAGALGAGAVRAYPSSGALPPPLTLVIQVAGDNGVPIDAVGAAMNVTVTNPAGPGFLTVYPCGDRPLASNLNYVADQTVPNFVISALSPDGAVCIDTMAVVDVVVDLDGYLPAGSPVVMLPQPTRIVDSRSGVGVGARMQATDVAPFQVGGVAGVPADASMVLFNATAVDTGGPGFLTLFPCGEGIPPTSTLNFTSNAVVPNFAVARLGSGGQVCAYTIAPMDLVIDVAGYVPAGAGGVVPMPSPQRILDSRNGTGGPLAPLGPAERALQVTGVDGVPDGATGVIANLTATQGSAAGFVTAYPCGAPRPLASNLNFATGVDVANFAVLKLGAGGQLCLVSNTAVDVVVDVTGYLLDDSVITSLQPRRLYDSREPLEPRCFIGVRASASGVDIFDMRTNAVIGSAALGPLQSPRAFVRDDCQHIDVVADAPPVYWHGWELDRSGNVLASYALPDIPEHVLFTNDGPLVLHATSKYPNPSSTDVRDAMTGLVLFTLPDLAPAIDGRVRTFTPVGATSDGLLLALQYYDTDSNHKIVSYWTIGGVNAGEWRAPLGAGSFGLSPLGTYLSFTISIGSVDSDLIVATTDGIEVSRLHQLRLLATPFWMTDGSMTICQPGGGLTVTNQRWDLFAPVVHDWMLPVSGTCVLSIM